MRYRVMDDGSGLFWWEALEAAAWVSKVDASSSAMERIFGFAALMVVKLVTLHPMYVQYLLLVDMWIVCGFVVVSC